MFVDRSSERFCSFLSLFVTRHFFQNGCGRARARNRTTSSSLSPLNTTFRRESFFCSLLSSKREWEKRVKYSIFREIYNWKDWGRDISQCSTFQEVWTRFCSKKGHVNTPIFTRRTKTTQTLEEEEKRAKKIRFFLQRCIFYSCVLTLLCALFCYILLNRSGGNFSAPPRDDSETFKTSVAGQSNWNAYEGSGEKELTPEEKKAKAKAEEDASNARRAAAAAKMQAEREKAGYKGSIF